MLVEQKKASGRLLTAGAGLAAGFLLWNKFQKPAHSLNLQNKVVVITGGSRGLGLALAEQFGKAGARLVLAARHTEELERAKQLLISRGVPVGENSIELFPGDLREESTCLQLVAFATAKYGRVDVLVNNAGVIHVGPVEKQPIEAFREAMEIDFFAPVNLCIAVLPQMLERQAGSIVNITSIGGKIPVPHLAPYTAAKFAATGFSNTLNAELRSKGIRVTTVCPGLMRTGSYPNAIVVGDVEKEYRWFSLSASLPGVAHSALGAAKKIVHATVTGRTEITIGLDAFLAARFYGMLPETATALAALADRFILPETAGANIMTPARRIRGPQSTIWQSLSKRLTQPQNQPPA